ncbi:MAG: type II secretion system F family protein [Pseudomonadota bacterium]
MFQWTDLLIFGTVVLVVGLALPAIVSLVGSVRQSERLVARLEGYNRNRETGRLERQKQKPMSAVLSELGKRAMPGNSEQVSAIRFRLMRAGFIRPNAVSIYFAIRLLAVVIPQIIVLFSLGQLAEMHQFGPLLGGGGAAVAGLMLPEKYLDWCTSRLEREYREGFPDMLDLMVACVEAGVSIDSAVTRVASELVSRYPNLAMHLNIIALEFRAGRSRQDAWQNFAQRLGLDEAESLTTMLRQAEEMGTSIGETLRIFSREMRQKRMLMAEERALSLSAKLTVPLIIFVFPVVIGVLLLPAIVKAMATMGGG